MNVYAQYAVHALVAAGALVFIGSKGLALMPSPMKRFAAFPYASYTNVERATLSLTNTTGSAATVCVKGIVTNKSALTAESMVVCGEAKPRSTITLEAPYKVGQVKDLCSKDAGGFLGKQVDWDLCTFDMVDVPVK